jgi:hypothetical protein
MTSIIGTFAFSIEKLHMMEEFKKIAHREGKNRSTVLVELIEQYVKVHGEGNPAFTLDQFQDPNFKAMPATMSSKEKWNEYIRNHMDRKERDELQNQAEYIKKIIDAADWVDARNAKISNSS